MTAVYASTNDAIALTKHSPLSGVYRDYPVQRVNCNGWQMAEHFGNPSRELQQLQSGSVLVDWSHIGKISISGKQAGAIAETLLTGASAIPVLTSISTVDLALLRLTANDYLVLCQCGDEAPILQTLETAPVTVTNQTGALGCLALAGARRDDVLERSTAMNVTRDRLRTGAVVQTTVHGIRCTLYRTHNLEIFTHPRSLSQSLFEALLDVGMGVGLVPAGLLSLPVSLASKPSTEV
jgi:aminomethyltransferase